MAMSIKNAEVERLAEELSRATKTSKTEVIRQALHEKQERMQLMGEGNREERIRTYLEAAGHADDLDGPLFRPLSHNRKAQEARRHMDPDAIDRVLRKHAKAIGLGRGYSAHSMRATFITTALENGATLDDVQRAAGHAEPGTTKLYDRRGYNPEKSASFFATY